MFRRSRHTSSTDQPVYDEVPSLRNYDNPTDYVRSRRQQRAEGEATSYHCRVVEDSGAVHVTFVRAALKGVAEQQRGEDLRRSHGVGGCAAGSGRCLFAVHFTITQPPKGNEVTKSRTTYENHGSHVRRMRIMVWWLHSRRRCGATLPLGVTTMILQRSYIVRFTPKAFGGITITTTSLGCRGRSDVEKYEEDLWD